MTSKYKTSAKSEPEDQEPQEPLHIRACTRVCAQWLKAQKQHKLPEPMPIFADDAARWWSDTMQEPRKPGEDEREYATRLFSALSRFLMMTDDQRRHVIAGVTEDKVPYRGDSYSFYMTVWDETQKMRQDPEAYKARAFELWRQSCGR